MFKYRCKCAILQRTINIFKNICYRFVSTTTALCVCVALQPCRLSFDNWNKAVPPPRNTFN